MTTGYIYCLSNQSMPGLLKIGMTTRTAEERVKELYTTGVPTPFKIEITKQVTKPYEKESLIHKVLEKYRIPSREFFKISLEEVNKIFNKYLSNDCDCIDSWGICPAKKFNMECNEEFYSTYDIHIITDKDGFGPQDVIDGVAEVGIELKSTKLKTIEDAIRASYINDKDKKRLIICLKKNILHEELKDCLTIDDWNEQKKCIENTTFNLDNDEILVYKVNSDKTINYIKTLKTSNYWHIGFSN